MLIDTHAHVNYNAYKDDADEVVRRSLENDIWMINVGSQYDTSKRAIEIAEKYKQGIYAAVALHPIHLGPSQHVDEEEVQFQTREEQFDISKYRILANHLKVVAIGETGLDYYYTKAAPSAKEAVELISLQKKVFKQHLELANELKKPVIFHCRKAYQDLIDELRIMNHELRGVIHCFVGKWTQAEEFLKMGFYLGFNGLITYCRDYDKVIKNTPLEKILVETDCPYLTPEPYRGKRNEPLCVKYVAKKIAEIKGVSFEKVAEQTTKNAKELFSLA